MDAQASLSVPGYHPPPHPHPPPHHAQAVCDAAKADKARQEWLEAELAGQTSRANASELEKAALQDRVQQLEVSPQWHRPAGNRRGVPGQAGCIKRATSWQWRQGAATAACGGKVLHKGFGFSFKYRLLLF